MTHYFLLILVTFIGMISDIRKRSISNKLILIQLISGIFFVASAYGFRTLSANVIGMIIPFCILFPAYILGKIGAADIKLLMVVELISGPFVILDILLCIFLVSIPVILLFWIFKVRKIPYAIAIFGGTVLYMGVNY